VPCVRTRESWCHIVRRNEEERKPRFDIGSKSDEASAGTFKGTDARGRQIGGARELDGVRSSGD
jgi:hypothetical protein